AGLAAGFAPLCLWGLDVAVTQGRVLGGLAGGGALLALAMVEPHYTYLVGGLLLVYLPIRLLTAPCSLRVGPLPALAAPPLGGAGSLLMLPPAFILGALPA